MASLNHNHNKPPTQQYQPGEIIDCDGWKWQCYCHDGPPSDWENDEKKMAGCMVCEDVLLTQKNLAAYFFYSVNLLP